MLLAPNSSIVRVALTLNQASNVVSEVFERNTLLDAKNELALLFPISAALAGRAINNRTAKTKHSGFKIFLMEILLCRED